MTGRLQENDQDQLEQWIGSGPKVFTLLYAITKDGCGSTIFHQKCDNQGPTVTVLYNPQGSVYGGYAGQSWDSSSGWVDTTDAFLYRLHYNHEAKPVKFSVQDSQYAFHCGQMYGPLFGNGNDLRTFTRTILVSNGQFTLNGNMDGFGSAYDNKGLTADEINNGSMNVIELEVYKVTAGQRKKPKNKPWRKTRDWTQQYLNELKKDVVAFKPVSGLGVSQVRILMVGPVGAGKSSFYNTINSIFREKMTRTAPSGSAEQSITTSYKPYKVNQRSGDQLKFRLCDTRGLEESQGLDTVEFNYLLEGNVPDFYKFHPSSSITPKTAGFKSQPSISDTIHCVVFVLDATSLEALPTKMVDKIKGFQRLIMDKEIPQLILLTKIDKVCDSVDEDTAYVFKSKKVEEHIEKASALLGLPRGDILPMKNYEKEAELDESINILTLLSLRQILHYAEDFLIQLKDKMDDEAAQNEV